MVQPFNYMIPQADPFAGVMQGLKLGATMQDIEAQRAQQVAAAQLAQQKAEQQRLAQEAMSAYLTKPSAERTLDDTRGLIRFLPADQVKNLIDIDSRLSEEERRNKVLLAGQVGSALRLGKPDVALNLIRPYAEAETDPRKKQGHQLMMAAIEKGPEAALEMLRLTTIALGPNYESAAKAMFGAAEVQGRTISSAADKVAAGITDAEGKPLSGTFFVEPGKEPKLVTGAKPGFTILTPQEAAQRGLPTQGYTWQINRETNDISSLVKPSQAAVQVNIPGQPTPPTKLEEEIDKKFAPMVVEWMGGEKTKAASRINQLKAVANMLESGKRITGPVVGLTPDVALAFVNPASREARANAEKVIQEGLKAVLGAQFTRPEGEAYLARSYDPKAPQADNLRRLRSIVTQMEESAKDRESMMKYMQGPGKGSLKGYTGRVPTIDDFYAAIEVQTPAAPAAPAATARSQAVDAALQKYKTKSGGQ
jgi:CheY-like chemotaxis protein